MVKKLIRWIQPSSVQGYDYVEIWWTTDTSTSGTEFTSSNNPDYVANGLPLSTHPNSAVDLQGATGRYYRIRFYDSTNNVWSDYSSWVLSDDWRGYCTVEEFRNYTNIQSGEYSNEAVQVLIDSVTQEIDNLTGRTWQGIQTITDELIDGDNPNVLYLPYYDIISLSKLEIDLGGDGSFTSVTPSYVYVYKREGYLALNTSSSEVTSFGVGRRRNKVSLTYGNSEPTDDVKMLCLLMCTRKVKVNDVSKTDIDRLLNQLRIRDYSAT